MPVEAGEAAAAQQAHAHYCCHFAETLEPTLFDAEQGKSFDLLEREHENMRAALRWLMEAGAREEALRLGVALARFWGVRGHVAEGQQWLQSALARSGQLAPLTRARALSWAGWFAVLQREPVNAVASGQESLALFRTLDDVQGIALALHRLGLAHWYQGQDREALVLLEESVARSRGIGDQRGVAYSLMALGRLALGQRMPDQVRAWLEEALALFLYKWQQEEAALVAATIPTLAN